MQKVQAALIQPVFLSLLILAAVTFAFAVGGQEAKSAAPKPESPAASLRRANSGHQYSGMYSFLEDGEFVQITVEDEGKLSGFVSHYSGDKNDKGAFLEQFFRSGKLDNNKLAFVTETVDGEWFDFKGVVERGEGKNPGDEAYYVLKGTLIQNTSDGAKKVTAHSHEVVLKMFPEEASPTPKAQN